MPSDDPIFNYFTERPDLSKQERMCARLEALTDMADDLLDDDDEKEGKKSEPEFQMMEHVLAGIDIKNRAIGLVMLPSATDDDGGPRPIFLLNERNAADFIIHLQYLLRRLSQRPL